MQVGDLVLSKWQDNVRGVVIKIVDTDSFRIKWFSTEGKGPYPYDTTTHSEDLILISS